MTFETEVRAVDLSRHDNGDNVTGRWAWTADATTSTSPNVGSNVSATSRRSIRTFFCSLNDKRWADDPVALRHTPSVGEFSSRCRKREKIRCESYF
jgi:hypothetical protein